MSTSKKFAFWRQNNEEGSITTNSEGNFTFSSPTHSGWFSIDFATAQQAIQARTYLHGVLSVLATELHLLSDDATTTTLYFVPASKDGVIYFGTEIEGGPVLVVPYEMIAFNTIPVADSIK